MRTNQRVNLIQKYTFLGLMACGIMPLLCLSCVSLIEKSGRIIDGSAFTEKSVALYRAAVKDGAAADMEIRETQNKDGESSVTIVLNQFPAMKIRGSAPDSRGEFQLSSLDFLGGSPHGWNEYRLDLFGSGNLVLGETTAQISVPGAIEHVHISSGRIRRYDTRITGGDAVTTLRNRYERIIVLAEWLNERSGSPQGTDLDSFEAYWKPILLPEITAKKKRPENWQQEDDQWVKAEDIRWNTGYTERVFPEELWGVRNSGTLLRDWEEALDWLYIEYEWPRITALLAQETVLSRAKK